MARKITKNQLEETFKGQTDGRTIVRYSIKIRTNESIGNKNASEKDHRNSEAKVPKNG